MSAFTCCFKREKTAAITSSSPTATPKKGHEMNPAETDYYDFLGPSVHHLQTVFQDEMREAGLSENATVYDIEDLREDDPGLIRRKGLNVVCPIDGEMGSAYVHAIEAMGDDHVGTATFMLSYTWGYTFRDIIDTLVSYCQDENLDTKRTYVWICAFCNNQHRVKDSTIPFETFQDIFGRRVHGIGTILAMMTPWNDPGYLKRIWCIFEMYSASADNACNVKIIMPPVEKESLMNAVRKTKDESTGKSGLDDLFLALANTKVERANASWQSDKDNILRLVEEGPGYHSMNIEINKLLRLWVRDTVLDAAKKAQESLEHEEDEIGRQDIGTFLTYCATFFSVSGAHNDALELHQKGLEVYGTLIQNDNSKELMARCYNNIGTEYETLGRYEEALEMHGKCRDVFEDVYGCDHENTATSYFNIGAVYRKLGRNDDALGMYNKALDVDKKIKGDNHIDVANSYSYIGRVYQENKDYDEAQKMFEASLVIRENTYGSNHPESAIGYGDTGLLYHARGDYDNAIKMHMKVLSIAEPILGITHPDTASAYQNLGGAFYEKGDFEKALEYHTKAKEAYAYQFGPNHPKSETSKQWIKIVEEAMGE